MEYKIIEGIKYLDEEWVNQHIDKEVTKVICHSTLKKIGPYAFNQRSNLKEIVLNEGLEVNVLDISKLKMTNCQMKIT